MGCHGHGHWGYGGWHGNCWEPGPGHCYDYGYGHGPGWDEEARFAEPFVRGPYGRRTSMGRYAAGRASQATTTAQLEAHLAALRDEVRAVEADLAETRAAGERAESPDPEV